jgi:transposase
MPQLSVTERSRILFEYDKTPKYALVAKRLHMNIKTVKRWVKRHQTSNGVNAVISRKPPGRPRLLSEAAAKHAVELLLSDKHSGCQAVASELLKKGLAKVEVHRVTLSRSAKAYARQSGSPIVPVTGLPKKQLTTDTKKKRLAFCQAMQGRSWGHIMFTDRKKFLFRYPGCKVKRVQWVKQGDQRTANMVNHPMCLNVYAGLTKFGMTACHLVAGTSKQATTFKNKKGQAAKNITSQEYKEVVSKTLLPEGKRIFSNQGISSWTLQQDNDPTHKKAAREALEDWNKQESGVLLLPGWPPNSPDLSPIENVWAWAQQEVDAIGCENFEQFQKVVLETLRNVPSRVVNNLFASLPNRISQCLALEGDKTKY